MILITGTEAQKQTVFWQREGLVNYVRTTDKIRLVSLQDNALGHIKHFLPLIQSPLPKHFLMLQSVGLRAMNSTIQQSPLAYLQHYIIQSTVFHDWNVNK